MPVLGYTYKRLILAVLYFGRETYDVTSTKGDHQKSDWNRLSYQWLHGMDYSAVDAAVTRRIENQGDTDGGQEKAAVA